MEDASFVIDTKNLKNQKDYLCDGIGNFRNSGHTGRIFTVNNNKVETSDPLPRTEKDRPQLGVNQYLVKAVYWWHKKHRDFKKRTYEITSGANGNLELLVVVQYTFEHPVTPSKKVKTSENLKEKIRHHVQTAKTPSTIYDNLFEEAGGLNLSDIPRNVDQIKNERKKIRNKGKFDDFATLLKLSSDNEFMHNLQWTPHPRAVVPTDSVVQDIVDNCTRPDSFQPFTIDTTFNIGPFYVTTTTYKHLKLIDKRSGKNPNLPGPALFHARQNTGQFTYFAQTLNEMNGGISNILAIGSDHCNAFSDGLRTVCPLARVLICKKTC